MQQRSDRLVSVITPAYNAVRFIGRCIESVLAQKHLPVEMLIADDCSTDETARIVRGFSQLDPRIRLVSRESNGGPSAARNTALKAASGRYVAFLDSDDYWMEGKLEQQLRFMDENDAALSFTQYRRVSEEGAVLSEPIPIPRSLDYAALLKNTAIATSTVVIDRSKTGTLEMPQTFYDDFALWLSLLKKGFLAHGLSADLMRYRVVPKSWSRSKMQSALQVWRAYRQVEHLSLPYSMWCFSQYAWNALRKYNRWNLSPSPETGDARG